MEADSELVLVERAQSGDRDSYGRLADLYGGVVLAIAYSRIGNYTVAEDIAQDAFLIGFENLSKLRQPQRFGSWLKTITAHLCTRWHRSQAYRSRLQTDSVALRERLGHVQPPSIAEKLDRREAQSMIDEALRKLPVRDRKVILLYYFENKSVAEAAKALDISTAAMKKRLERARKRLRDRVTAQIEADLLEAAKGRKMSSRVLAAIPLGASYAKIAPVASVLPLAPALHVAGLLGKMGGVVMGINKAAGTVAAICAVLVVVAGGLYVTRVNRPPASSGGVAQPTSTEGELARVSDLRGSGRVESTLQAGPSAGSTTSPGASALRAGTVSDTGRAMGAADDEETEGADFGLDENASVSGRVTDSDMKPIDGAELKANYARKTASATNSDADGQFRLTDMTRNVAYRITASASGYGTVVKLVAVPGSGDVTGVDFVLEPGAIVSGYVVEANGGLVPDAHLTMSADGASVSGPTDAEGAFEIQDVAPGAYTFSVSRRGRYQRCLNEPLSVEAGEEITDLEVVVAADEGAIEGFAVNEQGDGIAGVNVMAYSAEGTSNARTDDSGLYCVEDLGNRAVGIKFTHSGYADAHLADVPVGTMDADVVMLRYGSISGIVMDASTLEPVHDFTVATTTEYENLDGVLFERQASDSFSSEGGEFVIENVQPGVVRVTTSASGYTQQELREIVVQSGEVTSGIEFLLSRGYVVRGTVVAASDSHPVAGADVYLGGIPDQRYKKQKVKVLTAADGSFVLNGVPAGEQALGVRHQDFAPTSVAVTVDEGEVTDVTIELRTGGIIAGYVTQNDIASPGASMILNPQTQGPWQQSARTDSEGYYRFKGLVTGVYSIIAALTGSSGSRPMLSATVEVEEGYIAEKNFDFTTGTGVIEGYITENGEPVSGVDANVLVISAKTGQIAGRSAVDASGFYGVEGLAADSYRVSVSAVYSIAEGDGWSRGGARNIGGASVQLKDGATARVDIEIADSTQ